MISPSASRTPLARPWSTSIRVTRAWQRMSPPRDSSRAARAAARFPAPPRATGNPTSWASIASSHPNRPDPAASGGMSACAAFPAISSCAAGPRSRVSVRVREGSSSIRTKVNPPTLRSLRAVRSPARTGGNGESNAWTRASPMCVQSRYIRSQASPSPGWSLFQSLCGVPRVVLDQGPPTARVGAAYDRRGVGPGQPEPVQVHGFQDW